MLRGVSFCRVDLDSDRIASGEQRDQVRDTQEGAGPSSGGKGYHVGAAAERQGARFWECVARFLRLRGV